MNNKFFLCEGCLSDTNVGKYLTKRGHCSRCGETEKNGNYVTHDDIDNADKLGEDSTGTFWRSCLVTYNVANTDAVCPNCGYYVIERIKREHMNNGSSSGPARYKCNDCGQPLKITNRGYEPPIDTEEELKRWLERHAVIIRPGQKYQFRNKTYRLCNDGNTLFFLDYKYRVFGRMLTASTCKTREMAVSKIIIDAMFQGYKGDECRWRAR